MNKKTWRKNTKTLKTYHNRYGNPNQDWNTMFSRLELFYRKHGHTYIPSDQQALDKLFDWTIAQKRSRTLLAPAQLKKLESLNFDWDVSTDHDVKWMFMYQKLAEFKREHGHVKVPQDFKEDPTLGRWVSGQRRRETQGKLSKKKKQLLSSLGFLWKKDITRMREQAWENRYRELVLFKRTHGRIDRLKVKRVNYQLGLWIETQMLHQQRLPRPRKEKLNAIGFQWDKGDFYEERWNEMFQELTAYRKKHGHCQVKRSEDFKLSVWLQRQKRDREKLPADKRKKLETAGIKWAYEYFQERWETMYKKLRAFRKMHGHVMVSRSDMKLFEWIQTQRALKAENKLNPVREEKLVRLGFVWKGETEKRKITVWESLYKRFKTLKERYSDGYALVIKREYPELNHWISRQLHSKEKLSAAKKKKLNDIGFPWKWSEVHRDQLWEEMYQQLVAYKKQYGHCDVPQRYPANAKLALWVNGQRSKKLSTEKRNKLDRIGFSWSGEIRQKRWFQRLDKFKELQRKNKLDTIRAHMPLHSWIYQQKKNFHKMPAERRRILLKAGIVPV